MGPGGENSQEAGRSSVWPGQSAGGGGRVGGTGAALDSLLLSGFSREPREPGLVLIRPKPFPGPCFSLRTCGVSAMLTGLCHFSVLILTPPGHHRPPSCLRTLVLAPSPLWPACLYPSLPSGWVQVPPSRDALAVLLTTAFLPQGPAPSCCIPPPASPSRPPVPRHRLSACLCPECLPQHGQQLWAGIWTCLFAPTAPAWKCHCRIQVVKKASSVCERMEDCNCAGRPQPSPAFTSRLETLSAMEDVSVKHPGPAAEGSSKGHVAPGTQRPLLSTS